MILQTTMPCKHQLYHLRHFCLSVIFHSYRSSLGDDPCFHFVTYEVPSVMNYFRLLLLRFKSNLYYFSSLDDTRELFSCICLRNERGSWTVHELNTSDAISLNLLGMLQRLKKVQYLTAHNWQIEKVYSLHVPAIGNSQGKSSWSKKLQLYFKNYDFCEYVKFGAIS